MADSGSISILIEKVRAGDEEAIQRVWDAYFPDLVRVARKQLGSAPRREADEEDVALSALNSFCQAAAKGRFPDLASRDGLWRLLSEMTRRKAVTLIRRALKQKRGGGRVRGESVFDAEPNGSREGLAAAPDHELTPDLIAIVSENCRRRFASLPEEGLRAIALAKLQGYTNQEIADQRGVSLHTIERRLHWIRAIWKRMDAEEA